MSSLISAIRARVSEHVENRYGPQPQPRRNIENFMPYDDSDLLNLANIRAMESTTQKPTIFGPSVGLPTNDSQWEDSHRVPPKPIAPALVNKWVLGRKEKTQETTTLQALVNLKASSLRVSPLLSESDDETPVHDAPHGLEFQYDCDSAKCNISIHVHALNNATSAPTTVFQSVFEGGFDRALRLEDDAALDLSHIASESSSGGPESSTESPTTKTVSPRKRHSTFGFRRHEQGNVAGPSLRVIDVDAATEPSDVTKKYGDGVRVTIRLEALNSDGLPLAIANVQTTSLHIVQVGNPARDGEEDTRHWVVQVVRRDASIGTHSFRLQDIYGLSSGSAEPTPVPAAETTVAPTYPPIPTPPPAPTDAGARSECVLCLSAPREIVLLPCRHLVACKACAIDMVEYGAGGPLVRSGEGNGEGEAQDVVGEGQGGPTSALATAIGATPRNPPGSSRRRRKAKGWHCPVCRQPYTSLLRISTAVPEHTSVTVPTLTTPAPAVVKTGPISGRPGFLRGLSSQKPVAPSTVGVEHPLDNGVQTNISPA